MWTMAKQIFAIDGEGIDFAKPSKQFSLPISNTSNFSIPNCNQLAFLQLLTSVRHWESTDVAVPRSEYERQNWILSAYRWCCNPYFCQSPLVTSSGYWRGDRTDPCRTSQMKILMLGKVAATHHHSQGTIRKKDTEPFYSNLSTPCRS